MLFLLIISLALPLSIASALAMRQGLKTNGRRRWLLISLSLLFWIVIAVPVFLWRREGGWAELFVIWTMWCAIPALWISSFGWWIAGPYRIAAAIVPIVGTLFWMTAGDVGYATAQATQAPCLTGQLAQAIERYRVENGSPPTDLWTFGESDWKANFLDVISACRYEQQYINDYRAGAWLYHTDEENYEVGYWYPTFLTPWGRIPRVCRAASDDPIVRCGFYNWGSFERPLYHGNR